jgi:hypothetical protein
MFNDGILSIGFGCELAEFLQNYNNINIGIFLIMGSFVHIFTKLQQHKQRPHLVVGVVWASFKNFIATI